MRRFRESLEETPFPEDGDREPPRPSEPSLQTPRTQDREGSPTVPPSSEVQPEDMESPLLALKLSDMQWVPLEAEAHFCLTGILDIIPLISASGTESHPASAEYPLLSHLTDPADAALVPVQPMHPRTARLSSSSAGRPHSSDGGPGLHSMSAGPGDATVLENQSGHALFPGVHASAAYQAETSYILPPKQRKTSSDVWQHFVMHRTEKNVALCNLNSDRSSLGTAPLCGHLVTCHPLVVSPEQTALSAAQLQPGVEDLEPWDPTHPTVAEYNTKCAWVLVENMLPYSLVDNTEFREFMHLLAPKWRVPGQSYFKWQAVPALERELIKAIEQEMRKSLCPVVHFTTGIWPINLITCYVAFIAHWLMDNDGILCRHQAMLAVCETQYSKMTETISQKLKEMRVKWFHPLQLTLGYVASPTRTLAKVVEESSMGPLLCLSQCLNRLIKSVIANQHSPIAPLLQSLGKISMHFEQSPEARCHLRELQLLYGVCEELLKEEMPKPSSYLHFRLQYFLDQQDVFSAYLKENPGLELAPGDWRLMHHLLHLLKPFVDTLTAIRKENASLGQILHELQLLESNIKGYFQLLQQETDAPVAAIHLVSELLQSLESSQDLGIIRESIPYQTATFLHPRFKDHICKYLRGDVKLRREQLKERLIEQVKKEYLRHMKTDRATSPLPGEAIPQSKVTEVAGQELESYLQDEIDPTQLDVDPLVYWNAKRHTWPSLSVVALQYFSCPPTTMHWEKLLSTNCSMTSVRFQEKLAFLSVNRDWIPTEFRVPCPTAFVNREGNATPGV
ncbi:zinc finger BED domain-containing protein 4-like [Hemicordylus capensis]|uniref:zinc finger BED domain-containing protein 4-like n=1 Tax=Hemicordylus capensis TaxID=884348 RepID=UPI002302899F|nr:zinc finger BED domain-containing protein 4-like [Hemicordylus capensis]